MRARDARSALLARELAELVRDDPATRLAAQVLDGGPLAIAHAVRLAGLMLDRCSATLLAKAEQG